MNEVKRICEQLQKTSSKSGKEQILKDNINNENFKYILNFLLNPFITTGLSEKKINKNIGCMPNINKLYDIGTYKDTTVGFINLLEYIKKNNTGKDIDISACEMYFTNFDTEMQEFIKLILTKSLKLGIDAKTVNTVYGKDFIPTFSVQLGTPIDKCKLKGNEKIYISQKLNGVRCLHIDGKFYTRSGKEYTRLNHIADDIAKLNMPNIVLDGELIRKNTDGVSDSENFQIGTGIANSKDTDKSCMEYVIFDVLLKEEFEKGQSEQNYSYRKKELLCLQDRFNRLGLNNIRIVPMWYEGNDHSEIQKWLDYAEENDYEGCIINLDTPYFCKRVKSLMKVKCFYDVDIYCLRIEKGTGKNANTLGAIVCDFKGNEVNVGSGFTDEQRNFYYTNPNEIVGKIVTVKYKEVSKNKNNSESLQFPVFVCVRTDKEEENYN